MNPNRNFFPSVRLSVLCYLVALAPSLGCDSNQPGPTETGDIMLSVPNLPDDVACIRVSIAGEFRSVVNDFDVAPGDTLAQSFSGLPVGAVVFSANAYAQACASVTSSTVPMWISEDKTVTVVQGKSATVTLVLLKNGRAKVTVQFGDQDDGGSDAQTNPDGGLAAGG